MADNDKDNPQKFTCSLPGPWNTEPDHIQWKTEAGFPALIVRHREMGNLCGYVAVPKDHPCYGKGYDDVNVSVHGGLTYAAKCYGRVCHVPEPGESDDVWWLGFDAAHFGDMSPGTEVLLGGFLSRGGTYRDITYMTKECEDLAQQLKNYNG